MSKKYVYVSDNKLFVCDEGDWVTLKNGVHVEVNEQGNIEKGPTALKNQNIKEIKPKETSLQKMKRWENTRIDGMKAVAASRGKYTSLETHYPDGRVRKQYFASGRWIDTKPKGLEISHGHWQDKPYIVNIDS